MRIALVSTPWPLFNRPSIQLGALKAFLRSKLPEVEVDTHHLYLKIAASLGYPIYEEISQSAWLAEPLYGALLYPLQSESIKNFWKRRASRTKHCRELGFDRICEILMRWSQKIVFSEDWSKYDLIGFSICFSQLTSSLYIIEQIHESAPNVPIVVGGSSCAADLGRTLLSCFPQISYVIQGEGELPLLDLVAGTADISHQVSDIRQVTNLDELPPPDYDDYFETLKSLGPGKSFLPKIPVELSRGCWWNRCAFCNLNLQWKGYRSKSINKILSELQCLSTKYQTLGFSFMDNLLPKKDLEGLFGRIRSMGKDLELFAEIRATTPRDVLKAMGSAGMREVQVGIEGLSSGLLRKLKKGTTAIDNMEIMKNCESPDLPSLTGNLIMEFPGSDPNDVEETLVALDFALPLRPLKAIPFWLGYGSPVWSDPRHYGVVKIFNHPNYRHVFPQGVNKNLTTMIQGYHGHVREQRRLWRPVKEKVAQWKERYIALHDRLPSEPILSYRDGGDFLIIRQRRANDYPMSHKLKGTSRRIYLFCETQRHIKEVLAQFPSFAADQIEGFFRMMVSKRLMFQEENKFLSLAVPARICPS